MHSILLLFLQHALLGLLFVIDKLLLSYFPPLTFLAIRSLSTGAIFFVFYMMTGKDKVRDIKRYLLSFVVLAFFYIYATNILLFKGLRFLTAGKASLIYNCYPFIVAVLAVIVFGERLSKNKIIGLVIGWVGFAPIIFFDNPMHESMTFFGGISFGELYVLGSAVTVAISSILLQRIMHGEKVPAVLSSTASMLVGGVMVGAHAYITEFTQVTFPPISPMIIFLFGALLATTIGWSYLNSRLSKSYKASTLSITGLTSPLFAALFSWLFLGTSVTLSFYISLVAVSLGLTLFYT